MEKRIPAAVAAAVVVDSKLVVDMQHMGYWDPQEDIPEEEVVDSQRMD